MMSITDEVLPEFVYPPVLAERPEEAIVLRPAPLLLLLLNICPRIDVDAMPHDGPKPGVDDPVAVILLLLFFF